MVSFITDFKDSFEQKPFQLKEETEKTSTIVDKIDDICNFLSWNLRTKKLQREVTASVVRGTLWSWYSKRTW